MKKLLTAAVLGGLLLIGNNSVYAQANDSAQIKETCVNYVEGFYTGDGQRVAKAASPELVKRIVMKDSSGDAIQNMSYSLLVLSARKFKNNGGGNNEPFKADVYIYDITNGIATCKVVTNKFKFIDYVQLAKINGEWKLVNVLWGYVK